MEFSWDRLSRLVFCFLQSEKQAPGMGLGVGEEEEGVTSPLLGSLSHIRLGSRGGCVRSQLPLMGKCGLEGTSRGPWCNLLLWAGQTSKFSEVPQLLRHRGFFPALQLEREKSRAIIGPRHSWDRTCSLKTSIRSLWVKIHTWWFSGLEGNLTWLTSCITLVYIILSPPDSKITYNRLSQDNPVSTRSVFGTSVFKWWRLVGVEWCWGARSFTLKCANTACASCAGGAPQEGPRFLFPLLCEVTPAGECSDYSPVHGIVPNFVTQWGAFSKWLIFLICSPLVILLLFWTHHGFLR